MRWLTFLLIAIAASACGGDELDDLSGPDCIAGTTSLEGTIDGTDFALDLSTMSRAFQQIQEPFSFEVMFADGGQFLLEWNESVFDGDVVEATGTITMPTGAPRETETLTAGSGSAVQPLDTATRFRIAAAEGEIDGCVGD